MKLHMGITVAAVVVVGGIVAALLMFAPSFEAPEPEQENTETAATTETETSLPLPEENPDEPLVDTQEPEPEPVVEEEVAYTNENTERFVVPLDASFGEVVDALHEKEFIKSKTAFTLAWAATGGGEFTPGGYWLAGTMNAFALAGTLRDEPYMKWIVIPEGLRKEEIAEMLANTLGWTDEQQTKWIDEYTALRYDHVEGVYFPDTYLIPVSEAPIDVAKRLVNKFNEKFAAYLPQFNEQNIQWTTGLTLASLVQREAASDEDMPLIAGILWNRLERDMYLNVDATLQYVRGDTGSGWWAPITTAEKQIDSPYNTYTRRGLPPHPIANPGLTAIEAVLNPASTTCLYYLHDDKGVTHCANTYEGHLENIEEYLK